MTTHFPRTEAWCHEHNDFAWLYDDNTFHCFYVALVESGHYECRVSARIDAGIGTMDEWQAGKATKPSIVPRPPTEALDVLPLLEAWQTHIACDHDDSYTEGCLPVEVCLKGILSRLRSPESDMDADTR